MFPTWGTTVEMESSPEQTTRKVAAIEGYRIQFEAVFGSVTFENICRALSSFQRVLITAPTAWDFHRSAKQLDETRDQWTPEDRQRRAELDKAMQQHPMQPLVARDDQLLYT